MTITDFFRTARKAIAEDQLDILSELEIEKPKHFNWVEEIFYPMNVEAFPDDKALLWRYYDIESTFSFREIYELTNQFLNFLRKHGIEQGDLICSQLPLVPANWISMLATIKGGFIISPTATNLTAKDLAYRFETLFPKVMIAAPANAELVDEAEQQFDTSIALKIIVGGKREGWFPIEDIYQEDKEARAAQTRADDPFLYFFTSGTTGMPKVVVHTHFTYPFGHLATCTWVGARYGDLHYNISAPGWAKFAWSSFFAPWNTGATIFANQVDSFVPKDQLAAMETYGVSTFCASPTVLRMLIQEDLSAYSLKLRRCAAAGEPLNPDVIEKWKKGTGTDIRDGYGQTETTLLVGNIPGRKIKPGSMGKASFMYDIIICDDNGNELSSLEEGVICVKIEGAKHNGVFVEYLADQDRTKGVFKHGLYYTGDKAYKDEEGYIWFVGRNDDVIKASAYRIGPFEVESVLNEHDAVLESAVVASPHEVRGYAVKAFVMLREGTEPSKELAEDLFRFAENGLAKYKIPRIIEFPESLPKTISGKIRRIELRANEAMHRSSNKNIEQEYFHAKY